MSPKLVAGNSCIEATPTAKESRGRVLSSEAEFYV